MRAPRNAVAIGVLIGGCISIETGGTPMLKIRSSFEMKRAGISRVKGLRGHLIAGVTTLSVVLFTPSTLLAQATPDQRLTDAYRLEREGKAAPAIAELKSLLDSKSLDPAGVGKAWNVLGLALEDQGDFDASRHAFEQSIQGYESAPGDTRDYA